MECFCTWYWLRVPQAIYFGDAFVEDLLPGDDFEAADTVSLEAVCNCMHVRCISGNVLAGLLHGDTGVDAWPGFE